MAEPEDTASLKRSKRKVTRGPATCQASISGGLIGAAACAALWGGWQLARVGGSGDARAPGGEGDALVALGPAEPAGLREFSCGPGPSPPPQREASLARDACGRRGRATASKVQVCTAPAAADTRAKAR